MDFEEFRKIIDNVQSEEEYIEVTSKMDITPEEFERLVEDYNRYLEPGRRKVFEKQRKIAIILSIFWFVFGFLFYYFLIIEYKILSKDQDWMVISFIAFSYVAVLIFLAWRIEKKYETNTGLSPIEPRLR